MEFKIDTKDNFTTICPIAEQISAKLAGDLAAKCEQLRQSGSKNFIIDLQYCKEIDPKAIQGLVNLHEESYGLGQSLVFTGVCEEVMAVLKRDETDMIINIAPSMKEAIDIVSMEILERDLLAEEDIEEEGGENDEEMEESPIL